MWYFKFLYNLISYCIIVKNPNLKFKKVCNCVSLQVRRDSIVLIPGTYFNSIFQI